nr:hypothetical protein [Tanacetum cinerariifolium]
MPIVRFAITFNDLLDSCGLERTSMEHLNRVMTFNLPQRHSYIPDLARKWGKICPTAERRKIKGKMCIDTTDSDPPEQPESDKRTHLGIDNLLTNSVNAVASVDFKTIASFKVKADRRDGRG